MLITVSGMVGSGKSTTADLLVQALKEADLRPVYLRFRYLKLLGFSRPERPAPSPSTRAQVRAQGFALRALTAPRAAAYLVRVIAFRLSGIATSQECVVMDRYFYDNFVQYRLLSRRERLYAAVLRRLIPRPHLALLLTAEEAIISSRRPNYATEYVQTVGRRYRELQHLFPNLRVIRTDSPANAAEAVRIAVADLRGG